MMTDQESSLLPFRIHARQWSSGMRQSPASANRFAGEVEEELRPQSLWGPLSS